MLAITTTAAEAIKDIVDAAGVPQDGGVRIVVEPVDDTTAKLEMTVAEAAEPGDTHLAQEGANLFIEQSTAYMLDGKVLDATVRDDGVEFSVFESPASPSSNGHG